MWSIWGFWISWVVSPREDREVSFMFHKLERITGYMMDRLWLPQVHSITFFHLFLRCVWLPLQCPQLYLVPSFVFALSSDYRNRSSWYFQFRQPLLSTNLRFRLQICHWLLFFWKMTCNSFCLPFTLLKTYFYFLYFLAVG